tara:strand:+ start:1757 stop:2014 length:258 start_codon:yes stop_codon:yes gene_type:complete
MEEIKEYKIETLKDLCDVVNNDNVEVLSADLILWLKGYNESVIEIRDFLGSPEGLNNTDVVEGSFVWIDDNQAGLRGVNIEIKID